MVIAWAVSPNPPSVDSMGTLPPAKLVAGRDRLLVVLKRASEATEKAPVQETAPEKPEGPNRLRVKPAADAWAL